MPETARIEHAIPGKQLPDLSAAANSNGPDRDEFLFMVGQLESADSKVKEARDGRKKLRQHFSNRGVNLDAMDLAMAELDKEDGTTLDNLRDLKRYFEFLNLPIGHQFSFLDHASPVVRPAIDVLAQAYNDGRERGIKGLNTDDQKWMPMTPEGQEHLRGWTDGQKVHHAKFRDLATGLTEAEAAEAKKKAERAAKKAKKNGEAEPEDGSEEPAMH